MQRNLALLLAMLLFSSASLACMAQSGWLGGGKPSGFPGLSLPLPSTSGNVLTSNGSVWTSAAAATLATPVSVLNGGSGSSTAAGAPWALKGANTDITRLTGLTGASKMISAAGVCPLEIDQGTHADTANILKIVQHGSGVGVGDATIINGDDWDLWHSGALYVPTAHMDAFSVGGQQTGGGNITPYSVTGSIYVEGAGTSNMGYFGFAYSDFSKYVTVNINGETMARSGLTALNITDPGASTGYIITSPSATGFALTGASTMVLGSDTTALRIKMFTGQTAFPFLIEDVNGSDMLWVDPADYALHLSNGIVTAGGIACGAINAGATAFLKGADTTHSGALSLSNSDFSKYATLDLNGNVFSTSGLTTLHITDPGAATGYVRTFTTPVDTFQSSDQTITAAGALTLAHSLGRTPSSVWIALVCQTNEAGYTAGQVVLFGGSQTTTFVANENGGYSTIVDGTNLTVRYGSDATTFSIPHATTGAATALTNANWKARFFAR